MATLNLSLPANHVPQKANLTQNQKPFCRLQGPSMATDADTSNSITTDDFEYIKMFILPPIIIFTVYFYY